VYRIKQFIGSGVLQPVYVDGVEHGTSLSPGSYTVIKVNPGVRVIHSKSGAIDRRTEMNFHPGETYFVRFHSYMVVTEIFTKADLLSEASALPEISKMRLAVNQQ